MAAMAAMAVTLDVGSKSFFSLLLIYKSVGPSVQVNWPFGSGEEATYRFPIWTGSAVFDLQVTLMLPIQFQVNWSFGSREEAKKKIFKMAAMIDILDFGSERDHLILIYKSPQYILPSFESIDLSVQEKIEHFSR